MIDLEDKLLQFQEQANRWDGHAEDEVFLEAVEMLAPLALETLLLLIKAGRVVGADERWQRGALKDMREAIRAELKAKGRVVDDGLIGVKEAASFINQSETYVYRNWKKIGGRKTGKNIQFTKAGLQKWFESRPKAT